MSGCALRRWGSGTPCTKEPDTAAKKEMANALAAMMAERERQDIMWNPPQEVVVKEEAVKSTTTPHKRAEILRPQ
jgi:hypothetical protein